MSALDAETKLALRRQRGNSIVSSWSAGEKERYRQQHAQGIPVFHIKASPDATAGAIEVYIWGKTAKDRPHLCYTLLLGKPNEAAMHRVDSGLALSNQWHDVSINTYTEITAMVTIPGRTRSRDMRTPLFTGGCLDKAGSPLVVTISNMSECAVGLYRASGAAQDDVSHVIGCSCPDWHHRHKARPEKVLVQLGVAGDAYRGCKHMWALRTVLEMQAPSNIGDIT